MASLEQEGTAKETGPGDLGHLMAFIWGETHRKLHWLYLAAKDSLCPVDAPARVGNRFVPAEGPLGPACTLPLLLLPEGGASQPELEAGDSDSCPCPAPTDSVPLDFPRGRFSDWI